MLFLVIGSIIAMIWVQCLGPVSSENIIICYNCGPLIPLLEIHAYIFIYTTLERKKENPMTIPNTD